jgi:hypothetical protein
MNTASVEAGNNINKVKGRVIQTLVYFDIFQYPLSKDDIKKFIGCHITNPEFERALEQLVSAGIVYKMDSFYSLQNDQQLANRRRKGNYRAEKLLPKAKKIGAFLYQFPFVRAVAISGSLSKNYVEEKADIDFFIITQKNRLWIARSLMHMFKKFTYLLGRQHLYCMNFYIDEGSPAIPEKNIYTATEIMTLVPAAGLPALKHFFEGNDWVRDWLPNYRPEEIKIPGKNSGKKRFGEWLFNKAGDWLDDNLFQWSTRRWRKKENRGDKNIKGKVMNLLTGKHFARSNPESFQEKIIERYDRKMFELKERWPQYFD